MIHLKNKLNKTATLKQLREDAEKGYKDSWQPELQVEAFMKGAGALLNLLHLPRVSNSVCKCIDEPPIYRTTDGKEVCSVCNLPLQTDC